MGMGGRGLRMPLKALKLDGRMREHFTAAEHGQGQAEEHSSFNRNNPPQASNRTWGTEVYDFSALALLAVRPVQHRD